MTQNFQDIRRMCSELKESPQNPTTFQELFDVSVDFLHRNDARKVQKKDTVTGRRKMGSFLYCLVPEEGHRDIDIPFESHYGGDCLYITAGDLIHERVGEGIDIVELQTKRKYDIFGSKVPKYVRFSGEGHIYKFGLKPFSADDIKRFLGLIKDVGKNPVQGNPSLEEICVCTQDFVRNSGEAGRTSGGYCFKQDGTRFNALYTQEPNDAFSVSVDIDTKETRGNILVIKMPNRFRIACLQYFENNGERFRILEGKDVSR